MRVRHPDAETQEAGAVHREGKTRTRNRATLPSLYPIEKPQLA